MYKGQYFIEVTDMQCLFGTPWALLIFISVQFPAFINILIALERLVALHLPGWYRRRWKDRHRVYLISISLILTLAMLMLAITFNLIHPTKSPTRICVFANSIGTVYATVDHAAISLVYVLCFIVLAVVFKKSNRIRSPSKDELYRQHMILAITGMSVVMVSFPRVILILDMWKAPSFDGLFVGATYCLYATHSALSIVIYTLFRPDFRSRLLSLFGLQSCTSTPAIQSRVQVNMPNLVKMSMQ
ncbi:hypothetical protein OESDEN_05434 [Oesophagostomum dentatum]|uniref:G-protein coupled receptors family 1 profile domain-containing protein n=1 Tax=Oesophagostomum dentatum TaxID=61180 RepID=A0A0B1TFS5_OESDE|nr:hypothetical protein OESDEN_05434 [Oesophagostomum dentatum]